MSKKSKILLGFIIFILLCLLVQKYYWKENSGIYCKKYLLRPEYCRCDHRNISSLENWETGDGIRANFCSCIALDIFLVLQKKISRREYSHFASYLIIFIGRRVIRTGILQKFHLPPHLCTIRIFREHDTRSN